MDISFVTRKFQRSIAGLGLAALLATSVFTGSALAVVYPDVDSHSPFADQIGALSDAGIMTGYVNGNFGVGDTLTREQAAKILVLAFATEVETDASVTCHGSYSAWAEDYLATANLYGILEGDGQGNCNATASVTRAEFAKMAVSAAGLSNDGTMASDWFSDVQDGAWYDSYMGTAVAYSIMGGYENGRMGPGDSITRGQAAKMTYNAMNPVYNPPVDPGDDDDDDDDDDVPTEGGDLEVILSDESSEDYTYFAAGTNAEVAVFEVTASDEDVLITSFAVELASGDADSIVALALYNEEGTRISRVDTSIDSDDIARMTMLEGGYTVEAGTSELFRLVNTFDTIVGGANTSTLYSYAFDSSMIESNAGAVEVENDLVTGIFGLLDEDTGELAVDDGGTLSSIQVGETNAVIASFELEETSSDKDVWLWGISLENTGTANLEDAVTDLALYWDGDWVADGTQYGEYISFQMDEETAPMIEAGTNEEFEIQAKIIGESTEDVIFNVEEALDVLASDEDDNNVAVNVSAYAGTTVEIEAGAVSVVGYDAVSDKFRPDRQDVELGRFEVTPGTDGLELETLNIDFDITLGSNTGTWYVSDLFENFAVELNGTNYSMDLNGAEGTGEEYTVDLDRTLTEGTVYEFVVMADTFSTTEADANGGVIVDYTTFTMDMALENLGDGLSTDGLVLSEVADNNPVTDVTPSTVSFSQLEGETAGVAINVVSISSARSVVVGTEDVLAMEFEVEEEADVSDLIFSQVAIEEASGTGTFDNTEVSQVSLYQVNSDDSEILLDAVSGSQLASNTADFDDFEVIIASGTTETFRVYIDFVDDDANAALTFVAAITTYDVEDDDNNQVYDADDTSADGDFNSEGDQPTSARTITLVASGILYVEMDNEDNTYDTANRRWIQMGEDDEGLAALALRADNEDVTLEEWKLILNSTASTAVTGDADVTAATALALPTAVAGQLKKTGAAGTAFIPGTDGAYTDVDNDGTVTAGDIRLVAGGTIANGYGYANGTTVAAGDTDLTTALALPTSIVGQLRKTGAAGTAFVVGTDAAYLDVNNDGTVTAGDIRIVEGSTAATGLDKLGNLSDVFSDISIYNEDGVLVGTKSLSNQTNMILFDSTSTELSAMVDTTTTYYITGDLNNYGENYVGNLYSTPTVGVGSALSTNLSTVTAGFQANLGWTVTAVEATGDSSNAALDENGNGDSTEAAGEVAYGSTTSGSRADDDATPFTSTSELFGYIASELIEVELLEEAEGVSVSSDLGTGTMNLGIVAITNNSTENIEADGTDLKTQLESIAFQVNKNTDLVIDTLTIERIGGVGSTVAGNVVLNSNQAAATSASALSAGETNTTVLRFLDLDGSAGFGTDDEIAPGETAYYLVQGNVTALGAGASDDFIELSMEDLMDTSTSQNSGDGNVHWYDSLTTGVTQRSAVYMGSTTDIDAVRVAEID
ncbi:S-layer homology domain-containing protein [Candidatus Peregrinibacteria bacterium]|nr:MAG: S-layer homology domain-containing protein [Candidatus Peregrinibacteria bacterium]